MDGLALARLIHILGVVHWIGGLTFVTLVVLPSIRASAEKETMLARFEAIEGRFSNQVRVSVLLTGLSGFYMTHKLYAWDRFLLPEYWWMHAMVGLWALFMIILFVVEPFVGKRILEQAARQNPVAAMNFMQRAHWGLLALSTVTVGGGLLGAHGLI